MLDFVNLCMLTSFCALFSIRAVKLYSAPPKSPGVLVMVGTQISFLYAFTYIERYKQNIMCMLCIHGTILLVYFWYRDLDEAKPVEPGIC